MAIVIISSVMEDARRALAESLAKKLGCPVASREQLVEKSTEAGIAVGKLEVAVLKQSTPRERLARQKTRYLAFLTSSLCNLASGGQSLVYHGRAGNLLLPGVSHVLRVRLVPDRSQQIEAVMRRLRLDENKAAQYVNRLEEDVARWVHFVHGVELNDLGQYDLVVNLSKMSVESASATICSMAQLPDFQPTPASLAAFSDLCLASRARDQLGRDERTANADLGVSAQDGRVTVTYMPTQTGKAQEIGSVLSGLEGAREVVTTMAVTNLLWVSESFAPDSPGFAHITDLAQRWGAAVELMRLVPFASEEQECTPLGEAVGQDAACVPKALDATGGVEDDVAERAAAVDDGLAQTAEKLIGLGLFGGSQMAQGGQEQVVKVVKAMPRYSMLVLGDVFASKGASVRTRLSREMASYLSENVNVPVISQGELQSKFLFGPKQMARLGVFLGVAALIYFLVFTFQWPLQKFVGMPESMVGRVAATAFVVGLAPLVAYFWGGATGLLFKWWRFE